jgi:hypothetical protein
MRCTVYARENNGKTQYSIGISKKINEEWFTNFIPANFKKDVVLENKTKIDAKVFWLDFYINKEGKPVTTVFINEFDVTQQPNSEFSPVADKEELPF